MNSVPCCQQCQEGKGWGLFIYSGLWLPCRAPSSAKAELPLLWGGEEVCGFRKVWPFHWDPEGMGMVYPTMDGPGEVPGAACADQAAPSHGAGHEQPV